MAQEIEARADAREALQEATEKAERATADVARLKAIVDEGPAEEPESQSRGEQSIGDGDSAGGEAELRKDSMMAHLLDSLAAGKDIGHYGRLVFAMVARHFMNDDVLLGWLLRDPDFDEAQARAMIGQVEGRDYNPPKRERILEWQAQQEFPILPYPDDPECGNLYRSLKFPDAIYKHIEHYQEQKGSGVTGY